MFWVDKIGYSVGDRARYGLRVTLSNLIIQHLFALGSREGYFQYIPRRELFVGHWKDVAVVFRVFFRLDMLKYAGVTTN